MKSKDAIGIMVFVEGKHARQEYIYKTAMLDDGKSILLRLYGEDGNEYVKLYNKTYKVIQGPPEDYFLVDLLGIRWFETEGDKNVVEV